MGLLDGLGGTGESYPATTLPDPFPSLTLDYLTGHTGWADDVLNYIGGAHVDPGHQLDLSHSFLAGHNISTRPSDELVQALNWSQLDRAIYPFMAQLATDPWSTYIQPALQQAVYGDNSPAHWATLGVGPYWGNEDRAPLPTSPSDVTDAFMQYIFTGPNADQSNINTVLNAGIGQGVQHAYLDQMLAPYHLPDAQHQAIVDYFNHAGWGGQTDFIDSGHLGQLNTPGAGTYYAGNHNTDPVTLTSPSDPYYQFYRDFYGGTGNWQDTPGLYYGTDPNNPTQLFNPYSTDPKTHATTLRSLGTEQQLAADLQAVGLDTSAYTPGTTTSLPEGTPMANTTTTGSSGQPSPISYAFPFLPLLFGGMPGVDANGKPTWTSLNDAAWQSMFGTNALFGPQQKGQLQDLLTPLPLSEQEQISRDLLSGDATVRNAALAKVPGLQTALKDLNKSVLPGLRNLADTGYRTATPDLYTPGQLGLAEGLARTGDRTNLENAATTWMDRQVAPQLAGRYGAQLGTYGSDFGGELANQGRLFSADIADLVSKNKQAGLGLWGDMTSAQGLLDSQLSEAAAARRANALPLLGTWSTYASQLPMSYATDLSNFGGTARQTDEKIRPGSRVLDIYNSLLNASSPSNLGYVMQGQKASDTASLLNALAPQGAAFGGSALAGLVPSLVNGLSSGGGLLSNIWSGGGLDNSGSAGLLGDLGGLFGSVGSSLWSGLGSLLGGGIGNIFGTNNSAGGGGYDPNRIYS